MVDNNVITTGLAQIHRDMQNVRCNADLVSLKYALKDLRQSVTEVYHVVDIQLNKGRTKVLNGSL